MSSNYFETFSDAVDAAQARMTEDKVELVNTPPDEHWAQQIFQTGPLNYENDRSFNFEIATFKGKPTRKWFHINFYRTSNGRYELNTYVL
jgi:hypothetical protein